MTIRYPEGSVLLRNLSKNYPLVTHGQGVYLFDRDGKKYFDGSGGALVANLGHGLEEISEKIAEQMGKVAYVNGTQFDSEVMENAAAKLATLAAPLGLDRVALLASGSEAIEAAIKFARQLWVDRGFPKKEKLITRVPGYHGNTLYALSASGRPHYKKVYGPLLSPVLTVAAPYGYRAPFLKSSPPTDVATERAMVADYHQNGAEHYARELETLIQKEGADSIFAFIVEPVSGSSTGGWIPPKNYFQRVQEICRRHQILIIADEVMCGAGRTGTFFASASEHCQLKPDILVMGKGINAGMMPVSAILVKKSDVDTLKEKSGGFMHAQTYMSTPAAAATVCAVLDYFEKHQVLAKAKSVSEFFQTTLREKILGLPNVGCVAGVGHKAGVEFVREIPTRTPFPIADKFSVKFVQHAQDQGLVIWPNYGQADGVNGDLVMLGPSLLMNQPEAGELVDRLANAIQTFQVGK